MDPLIVYYSKSSGNTARFVKKLGMEAQCITDEYSLPPLTRPFVLVTPTYAGGDSKGAVPRPVIHFLNVAQNRQFLRGVISTGNRNFGAAFCLAGREIARRCQVPELAQVEIFGTPEDVEECRERLMTLFSSLSVVSHDG